MYLQSLKLLCPICSQLLEFIICYTNQSLPKRVCGWECLKQSAALVCVFIHVHYSIHHPLLQAGNVLPHGGQSQAQQWHH